MGKKVVTTCGTNNEKLMKSLGADQVIDYKKQSVLEAAQKSPFAPFSVIMDCVGGKELVDHIDSLLVSEQDPKMGTYLTIVGDKEDKYEIGGPITYLYYPKQTLRSIRRIIGQYAPNVISRYVGGKRYFCIVLTASCEKLNVAMELFQKKEIKPQIDSTFSFEDAKRAFEKLESGRAVGKIVIDFSK
eukprot:TRINITY_DN2273_c0_g1_i2.p1 TRINITY_DN2273_c0_g1~~TRINITY_DN2273_c0_g1_i2.p1  ORF type:complete len:187 (+),score=42.10 TRINITY_DN2273_c0_g1_i2:237-797(+)